MGKTAHIISHSHWDREWYLPFEKHRYYFIKLMNHLVEQFQREGNAFQSFHLDGQTVLLEDYFDVHPENREIITRLIAENKLHIGPWYVLQDAFLTSSEANIRNLQIGLSDANTYGRASKIGYFPDTFGIYGQAPQLLKQAGIDTAAFGRGVKPTGFNNTVSDVPSYESPFSEMIWKSPDGSSVLGILFANWYSNGNEIPVDEAAAKEFWGRKLGDAEKYASTSHLLFMNGCDHQPLQTTVPEAIETAAKFYPDYTFKHSSFEEYMAAVKEALPNNLQVIDGELRNQRTDGWSTLVNTASSRIYLKQMNHHCQTLLEKLLEPLASMNYLSGKDKDYPKHYIRFMWKSLMKNHPHDSICGCSVDEVHREMVTRFENVSQMGMLFVEEQAKELARSIDTSQLPQDGIPIIVMNTTGWEKNEVITKIIDLEKVYFSEMNYEDIPSYLENKVMPMYQLVDYQGRAVEFELAEQTVEFGYDLPDDKFRQPFFAKRAKLTFIAEGIPSFGYKSFSLVPEGTETVLQGANQETSLLEMENEFVHLLFHEDGSYDLTHKQSGHTFLKLGIYEDTGDVGNEYMYKEATGQPAITTRGLKADIALIEKGILKTVIQVTHHLPIPASADNRLAVERHRLIWHKDRKAGRSSDMAVIQLQTLITLEKGMKGPTFKLTIDNNATDHRLRVLFPTGLLTETHKADSIFEIADRPNTPEKEWDNPSFCHHQQRFASLSDGKNGLTVATHGLQEYEILPSDSTLAVTVLRSTAELGDWGYFPTPEAQCLGIQTAEWQVLPHENDVIKSQAFVDAYQYKVPLTVVQTDVHKGAMPVDHQFVNIEADGLVWTSLKMADVHDDLMVRWFNPSGKRRTVKAVIHPKDKSYKSTILEVKTNETEAAYQVENYEIITLGFEKEWDHENSNS